MFFFKSLHLSIFFFRAIIQHFTQFILGDFAHPQWQPNLHLSTFIHLLILLFCILIRFFYGIVALPQWQPNVCPSEKYSNQPISIWEEMNIATTLIKNIHAI